jgi:hypothetical protein
MKKQSPLDVTVTDEIRQWAQKKGWPWHLPDQFLTPFHDHFQAQNKRFDDAKKAFQNWINRSAPGGMFYRAEYWEARIAAAKRMEPKQARLSTPPARVAGITVDSQGYPCKEPMTARTVADVVNNSAIARQALAAARRAVK